jgi:hypothetical protein
MPGRRQPICILACSRPVSLTQSDAEGTGSADYWNARIPSASICFRYRVSNHDLTVTFRGQLAEYHSIRINDQWRVVFRWRDGAYDVQVVDYH